MSESIAREDVESPLTYMYCLESLPEFSDVEELRWKTLIGSNGERIGTIENIEHEEDTDRVEFMQIGHGGFLGFGAERFLVPLTVIVKVDEKNVYIDRSVQNVADVPQYDFERIKDPDYCAGVRAWWCGPVVPETP